MKKSQGSLELLLWGYIKGNMNVHGTESKSCWDISLVHVMVPP